MKPTAYFVIAFMAVCLFGAAAVVGTLVAGVHSVAESAALATVSGTQARDTTAAGLSESMAHSWPEALALAAFVCVLGFFFAKVDCTFGVMSVF